MPQQWQIAQGDVLEVLKDCEDASFDAVLCDPPYGLSEHPDMLEVLRCWTEGKPYLHKAKGGFMNQTWDSFVPGPEVWKEVHRVLKPGGIALVFSGTRTMDLMGLGLRIAGFEIKDVFSYLYGSGFPKSMDISKALDKQAGAERKVVGVKPGHAEFVGRTTTGHIDFKGATEGFDRPWMHDDAKREAYHQLTAPATEEAKRWEGYGTQLKPAWEPILVVQKSLDGTYAQNALKHGLAGLNIEASRIGTEQVVTTNGKGFKGSFEGGENNNGGAVHTGRWPANLILDETAAALLDTQTGNIKTSRIEKPSDCSREGTTSFDSMRGARPARGYSDEGGASRFFYTAKVSKREREAGLDHLPETTLSRSKSAAFSEANGEHVDRSETSNGLNTTNRVRNNHPTLKPLDLCRYLAKLILPPPRVDESPRRLLVPFCGASSEMIGSLQAGWDEVAGIEQSADYIEIGKARLRHWVPDAVEPSE